VQFGLSLTVPPLARDSGCLSQQWSAGLRRSHREYVSVRIRSVFEDAGWTADGRVLRHEDCVAVHKLLVEGTLADPAAAEQWTASCRNVFTWSAYFDGARRLPLDKPVATADEPTANGVAPSVDGLGSLHLSELTEQ
jgi:hypothetical protein